MFEGTVVSADFVTDPNDERDLSPGTYITIRIPDDVPIAAGRVRIEYVEKPKV